MALGTDLSRTPYFDDYVNEKDFYKILFQPGVSVQTRELNQLQTLLQKQVERLSDNIFKSGTVVNGCNFNFIPAYPYVKILDNEINGTLASPSRYNGNFIINETTGLIAGIYDYQDGFESADPNLKTLYLRYQNSGFAGNLTSFSSGDVLKVYDLDRGVSGVTVDNGSTGFSNNDTLIALSQIIANVSIGTIAPGDYLNNISGANVEVVSVDSTTLADRGQKIVMIKPRSVDLQNAAANSVNWTIRIGDAINNSGNTLAATIEGTVGSNFDGKVITNASGKVTSILVRNRGKNYFQPPHLSIKSVNNAGVTSLALVAKNYLARVRVASTANSVGFGYGFSISEGVVYQKGYFLRVKPQTIIVSKYTQTPDQIAVGFKTNEEIIDANIDNSLFDNSLGTENESAPGANRLKLVPVLDKISVADAQANAEFLSLVSWQEGFPYQQAQQTVYNRLGEEMARRTKEESGDYVVDSFLATTRTPVDETKEASKFTAVVDPGIAYVDGFRIQTTANFSIETDKELSTVSKPDNSINLNYGNFIKIKEVGGTFQFHSGDSIDLYDTARLFYSNNEVWKAANTDAVGTKIGTANIRSLIFDEGVPGTTNAVYRAYLFNVQMSRGKNFESVKSIHYNGTKKGIADTIQDLDAAASLIANTATYVTKIQEPNISTLMFPHGLDSLKNANAITYTYRTLDQTLEASNTGLITKDISAVTNEYFPYTGSLTSEQLQDLYLIPTELDIVSNANLTGNVIANTSTANLVGDGTTFTNLSAGQYVYLVANGTAFEVKRINTIVNNTLLIMDSNASFANLTSKIAKVYPKNIPVPLGVLAGPSANVNVNQNVLVINLGITFNGGPLDFTLGCNIERRNITQTNKTPNRIKYVKIDLTNNPAGMNGPWCLGVGDVFRLRGVYVGNSTVSNTAVNQISEFYVDHNQLEDYYGLSYLYRSPKTNLVLAGGQWLLVEFDYFSTAETGFYNTISYVSANTEQRVLVDSQPLSNLSSTINSFEIPEMVTNQGLIADPLNCFDFRPYAQKIVTPAATPGAAPTSNSAVVSFGNTANSSLDKKFPVPGTSLVFDAEVFIGRTDSILLDNKGIISLVKGVPSESELRRYPPVQPRGTLKIVDVSVPAYPALAVAKGLNITRILDTRVSNIKYLKRRIKARTIKSIGNVFMQPKGYSMADIGRIDRRLRDVEYYVSLSQLEANTAGKTIPSSIDPSLNRFKYGFYADDIKDYTLSDANNPQYAAIIEEGAAVPDKFSLDTNFMGAIGPTNYIDYPIVTQLNATWPDTLGPVCILENTTFPVANSGNNYFLTGPRPVINNPDYYRG